MPKVNKVGVIGSGVMGSGITQLCAQGGYPVVMVGLDDSSLSSGMSAIRTTIGRLVTRQQMTEDTSNDLIGRIQTSTSMDSIKDCDIIIEAIWERLDAKKEVFRKLGELCRSDAILASDTATLPVTELASAAHLPQRVIGIHLLSPAPLSKVVEIVPGQFTDDDTLVSTREFCTLLGVTTVVVKDSPGFVINRILAASMLEAARLLEAGVASKEDIDTCMTLGAGSPVGPIRLMDLVGLDQFLDLSNNLHSMLTDPKYKPPSILIDLVAEGKLGRKSGEGFYQWKP
jgi:3-hydroxybutyryl-CoA dehydrogenase